MIFASELRGNPPSEQVCCSSKLIKGLTAFYRKVIKVIVRPTLCLTDSRAVRGAGSRDVTEQCLTNTLHRDAGDRRNPGGIVNVMAFKTPGPVCGSEREVQCLRSFLSKPLSDTRCGKHNIAGGMKRSSSN